MTQNLNVELLPIEKVTPYAKNPRRNDKAVHSTDAWEITRDAPKDKLHPTQKPVALFKIPILNHTKPHDLVIEPFSGSGAQFIAAHETGRRCFGMDLDPKYVAVALERLTLAGLACTMEAP